MSRFAEHLCPAAYKQPDCGRTWEEQHCNRLGAQRFQFLVLYSLCKPVFVLQLFNSICQHLPIRRWTRGQEAVICVGRQLSRRTRLQLQWRHVGFLVDDREAYWITPHRSNVCVGFTDLHTRAHMTFRYYAALLTLFATIFKVRSVYSA